MPQLVRNKATVTLLLRPVQTFITLFDCNVIIIKKTEKGSTWGDSEIETSVYTTVRSITILEIPGVSFKVAVLKTKESMQAPTNSGTTLLFFRFYFFI